MPAGRRSQIDRWYQLTREILPAMAAHHRWPIRLDHCFMRVCLDAAVGTPWSDMIGRPAVRTMSDAQLAAAIAVGERIVHEPDCLPVLNAASLQGRRRARLSLTAA